MHTFGGKIIELLKKAKAQLHKTMNIREAQEAEIVPMHVIRVAVKENVLSNPDLITHNDYYEFLFERGKGWVCEIDNNIVGFAIIDLQENNIWALFVHPNYESIGVGKALHKTMLDWYFKTNENKLWLGTEPNSRAANFYKKAGWQLVGMHGSNELKFEITKSEWL